MNQHLCTSACLALGALFLSISSQAAEIPLNAIGEDPEGVTTELTVRESGPYVGVWLGAATGGQASFREELKGAGLGDSTAFTGGLKLGYYWRTPIFLRPAVEVEVAYLSSDLEPTGSVNDSARDAQIKSGGGNLNALVGTVNLVLALDLSAIRDQVGDFVAGLHPYIGAGLGGSYSSVETFETRVESSGRGEERIRVDGGSKISFAYQFLAGLEVTLDDDLSIFGEYKRISIENTGSNSIRDYERDLWVFGCKLAY